MGNEPPTPGSDYVTMDVDCLLVEPQNGNVSMDSVMRFSEKITDNALDSGEVPRIYGQSGAASARDKEDIHNERVLDAMPSGDGFQINDNFCSMGDDYLLGVEFGESITNIDYGSGEKLQVSVSNSQIQVPSSPSFLPWKSEITETFEFQNGQLNTRSSKSDNVTEIRDCGMLAEDKNAPESFTSQDISYRSSQGFHASVSESRAQGSDAVFINPWKSELNEVTPFPNGKSNTGSSGSNDDSNLRDCNYPYEEKAHASRDLIQVPDTTCTSHLTSEVKEVPNGENGLVHSRSFMLSGTPDLRVCKLTSESTKHASASCVSHNMGEINYSSGHSSPNLSDENDGRVSPTEEVSYSQHVKKNEEEMTGKVDQEKRLRRHRSSTASAQGNCNVHPMEKRLRKPTQRYIDELSYPITSKKRRELSSSKEESIGTKVRRKCDTGSKATKSDEEEFSVKAIQVPFGAIVNQECPASPVHVVLHGSDRTWTNGSRDDLYAPDSNQKRKNGNGELNHLKKSDDRAIALFLKNTEDCAPESPIKKRSARLTMSNEKKKYGWAPPASPKRKGTHLSTANKKKKTDWVTALGQRKAKDNSLTVANHRTPKKVVDVHLAVASHPKKHDMVSKTSPDNKKVDNCVVSEARQKKVEDDDDDLAEESPEQVSGRRKNHRLWSITEVGKLLDGVSQYGVGRWSRIKKLLFASSPHRTSVDLKDKWRNLLKASGLHDQSKNGGKKRNVPWRPLPKSVLRHVRELASMHPYPKGDGRRVKIARKNNKKNDDDDCDDEDDDDETTDITLSDYKRILQSTTNGGG